MLKYAFEKLLPGELASPITARETPAGWAVSIRLPASRRLILDFALSATGRRK